MTPLTNPSMTMRQAMKTLLHDALDFKQFADTADNYVIHNIQDIQYIAGMNPEDVLKVYTYGIQHKHQLLETDEREVHEFYMGKAYMDAMNFYYRTLQQHGENYFKDMVYNPAYLLCTQSLETPSNTTTIQTPESALFSCKKCKSKRVHVEQKQARSADEGMDVILECMECNHRSRIRG